MTVQKEDLKQVHTVKPTDTTFEVIKYHIGLEWFNRRALFQLIAQRKDARQTYSEMLEHHYLEEKGEGSNKSPRLVRFVIEPAERDQLKQAKLVGWLPPCVKTVSRDEWFSFLSQTFERNQDAGTILRSLLQAYVNKDIQF